MNPYDAETSTPNFWLSCMTIAPESKVKPLDVMKALDEENIECRPVWKPMHMQPVFAGCEFYSNRTGEDKPVSEGIFERGVCLPSDIKNTGEDMEKIVGIIRSLFV